MGALRLGALLVLAGVALTAPTWAGPPSASPAAPPAAGTAASPAPAMAPEVEAEIASLKSQVEELCKAGQVQEALPKAERLLVLREKALGADHPDTARSLYNLGLLSQSVGALDRAEGYYARSLAVRERVLGRDHADTAASLLGLAQVTDQRGEPGRAVDLYRRALGPMRKLHGIQAPEVIETSERLGVLLANQGHPAEARALLQDVVRERGRSKEETPELATALDELATVSQALGLLDEAEKGFRQALRIRQKRLGLGHAELVPSLDNLAGVHEARGEYAKAEILEQQALALAEKSDASSPMVAQACTNLGLLYYHMGDLPRAELLYKKAQALCEKLFGPDAPQTATTLIDLGLLYRALGDTSQAEVLLTRARDAKQKALGPRHPETLAAGAALAELFFQVGRYAPAQRLYEQVYGARRAVLGEGHPDTLRSLDALGRVYMSLRLHDKAAEAFERALAQREKVVGPNHPDVIASVGHLARARQEQGRLDEAARLYQQALAGYQRVLGEDAPASIETQMDLAVLDLDRGRKAEAVALLGRAVGREERFFGRILSFTSERQRLAYEKLPHPYHLLASLGQPSLLAEALLRRKGVVLDSIAEDRRVAEAGTDVEARSLLADLRTTRERLAALLMKAPDDPSPTTLGARSSETAGLQKRIEDLESRLARKTAALGKAREALKVTAAQVQQALPEQSVLVDFFYYPRYLGKGQWRWAYGAVLLPAKGQPAFVGLGEAGEVENALREWQRAVLSFSSANPLRRREFQGLNRTLYDRCWAPIEAALPPSTRTVVLCPDGQLNFASFAALVAPDDRFLAEKYTLRYVACGRDLLRTPTPSSSRTMVMFGNPDFTAPLSGLPSTSGLELAMGSPSDAYMLRGGGLRDLRGCTFAALPGTARECADLAGVAARAGWQTRVFEKSEATKAHLREVRSPHVLHLATHGFFLRDREAVDLPGGYTGTRSVQEAETPLTPEGNPMLRSGMALAGAQTTVDAIKRGLSPSLSSSGILTAEEVALLPLQGTWLVTLSACETALGEAQAGQGVLGLRRGFVQAGTQNLLVTLWPVADVETAEFMRDFYEAARKGEASKALAATQRDWLVRLRSDRSLIDAVRLVGPFIMSSQGR